MKTGTYLLAIILAFSVKGLAQYENNWVFGYRSGISFNTGGPIAISTNVDSREGVASVSSATGELLFYTEGSYVWDRDGNLMPNGSQLTPIPNFSTLDLTATVSTSQGALIVPIPDDPDQYYIFSLTSHELGADAGKLFYSIIDMRLNNGLGDVVNNAKGIFLDSVLMERMTAVAGDHCNIWLMVCSQDLAFQAYSITASGIDPAPVTSAVGLGTAGPQLIYGNLAFSPDRSKLAATQTGPSGLGVNGASLYDFDPRTGQVSRPIQLLPVLTNGAAYGLCFSQDNSKLYINVLYDSIYQYDVHAQDILASKKGVCNFSGSSALKLGPDGKIYFINGKRDLATIDFPNLAAPACGYTEQAVQLNTTGWAEMGLPNTVPVFPAKDSFSSSTTVEADCFTPLGSFSIQATNDSAGWDYTWNNGKNGASMTPGAPGTYWVSYYTASCNFNRDTVKVSFPRGVLPELGITNSCKNDNNGKAWLRRPAWDSTDYRFTWLNAAGDTIAFGDSLSDVPGGSYTVRIRTGFCDTAVPFRIPVEDYKVSFTVDSLACIDEQFRFTNTSDSGFVSFHWQFGDGQSSAQREPEHGYAAAGKYEVRLLGRSEICSDSISGTITVDAPSDLQLWKDRDSICMGESISFHPAADDRVTNISWDFGDGNKSITQAGEIIQHAYDQSGRMQVKLSIGFRACPDTAYTDTVYVFEPPKVNLGQDAGICLNGEPVYLKNLHPGREGLFRYLWNTGATTETLKVVHPGTYSLTVSSYPSGCSSTESIMITKDCYLDIPNAFTPDGDGRDDYFFPRQQLSKNVSAFNMQVFNRWGQLLYETTNLNGRGWDGQFNGMEQPQGVYVYLIEVEFENGRNEKYEGNVTLLR